MSYRWLLFALLFACLFLLFIITACSNELEVTHYQINTDKITKPVRLAVVTDLHSSPYGKNMQELVDAINQENPDAVLLVGDIFDNRHDNTNSWDFVYAISKQYPCYYVTGNHEVSNQELTDILMRLQSMEVHTLSGNSTSLQIHGQSIRICGVDDCLAENFINQIKDIADEGEESEYRILLSHRPEQLSIYDKLNIDLVIAGHAHGGQVRIPFFAPNGLYAPHQGYMPQYTGGLYEFDAWNLLVSRGLDKRSVKYPRIFNKPELVVLTII
jgi:predicted MPP superfamily phosphohydrolase